ncbi:response regulator [Methylocystis parvus]|uniref:Response regulator transcription factor n=1 Tax=Methylocystis parvus TaxID=134 RepID=A0A6B8MAW7_9HYPH|nr:response regulator transcription factor [Methylocystis parvus]QGM98423.1 response regulator transcription factor [Methylocystis parvus]WBK01243.1 response regulator transcription factor [Methylocystis parvus OBBP]
MRILIVEDQPDLAAVMGERLTRSGYVADCVGTLAEATEALRQYEYPLLLLDRRLPDGDGVSILQTIRVSRPSTRVMLVTAARALDEKINGLDAGADDYLTKPFDVDELLARIRAVLRRADRSIVPPVAIGDLSFDLNQHEAFVRGKPFVVSKRELLLLESLVRRAGRAVTHTTLVSEMYGLNDSVQLDALKMSVSRLRQRLKDCRAGVEIHTLRGIGYLIEKSPA